MSINYTAHVLVTQEYLTTEDGVTSIEHTSEVLAADLDLGSFRVLRQVIPGWNGEDSGSIVVPLHVALDRVNEAVPHTGLPVICAAAYLKELRKFIMTYPDSRESRLNAEVRFTWA